MNADKSTAGTAAARILVPLDGSEQARSALPYGRALAGAKGTIVLLTVVPSSEELATAAGEQPLNVVAEELRTAGQAVETQVVAGDPAQQIVAVASSDGAEMIVIGSHDRGAFDRLIHGSVADKVAREATVPVMVVRSAPAGTVPATIARLVLPLDGSPLSEESLPVATTLSQQLGASLYLVRAVNIAEFMPPAVGMGEAIPFDVYDQTEEELEQDARQYLDGVAAKLRGQGLTVETHVLSGPPAAAIAEATKPGDIIVLVSNERTGVMRWLLGSVAEQLVREDNVPVVLVPAFEEAKAAQ